jgi:hypothetical protein
VLNTSQGAQPDLKMDWEGSMLCEYLYLIILSFCTIVGFVWGKLALLTY